MSIRHFKCLVYGCSSCGRSALVVLAATAANGFGVINVVVVTVARGSCAPVAAASEQRLERGYAGSDYADVELETTGNVRP